MPYVGAGTGWYLQDTTFRHVGYGGDFVVRRPRDCTCIVTCCMLPLLLLLPLFLWWLCQDKGINCEEVGQVKSVQVESITGDGPLILGTASLPGDLQGLFWLSQQGTRSALVSFGGPTRDSCGTSTGQLADRQYAIRVTGDRIWTFAEQEGRSQSLVEALDLIYHFVFDDPINPKRAQIYPESKNLRFTLTAEWILDFEMELVQGGDDRWPGSVVWKRQSKLFGISGGEYDLVQVMKGDGMRIEPAWSDFVNYQNSQETGGTPGMLFYREISNFGWGS